ncbi:TonB-dependent receptor [Aliiglaciecola sp. 3_MG-2023]|uniref:TonB-dependent receptor n=1 Tax=Aliiglaciecola sp. 3_MG-2023 TaxID=3062644 RepID=UPI0026E39F51|nr:TonB-dependent receptor [Aliiglaciecola sp. 3_MG-2023]MDO6693124.1 TonB-dependent receptor [Aliiglaciecola sp. 3_MG-2023]
MKTTLTKNPYKKNKLANIIGSVFSGLALTSMVFATTANAQEADVEVIQVAGIRGSLEKATEVKRSLDVVADVISAEDIGKFPDQNLAESLQRVSGVQISRNRGEGSDVTIRGLSPDFTRVKFNGRTLPSATGGRSFDFTILPSDFVSALEVYKTPSADMEEGALSATINVRTPRPLSAGETSLVTSVKAVYEDNSGDTNPDVSALYTFVNEDKSFGLTLGAHYDSRSVESHIYEAFGLEPGSEGSRAPTSTLDYNLDGDTNDSFRFNHATNFSQLTEDRERTTLLATLQFRPTADTDIWLETMYSEFDVAGAMPLNSFRWTNVLGSVVDSSITTDTLGSDGLIERLEIAGVDNRNNARTTDSNDKLTSFSLGTKHTIDENWVIEAELSYAKSENKISTLSHEVIGRANAYYDFSNDYDGLPELGYTDGYDPLNGSSFRSLGFNGSFDQPTEDTSTDFRIDVDHVVDWKIGIYSVEFGAKYSAREKYNGFRSIGVSSEVLAGLLGETYDADIEGGSFDAGDYMTAYNPSDFFDGYGGSTTYPTQWLSSDVGLLLDAVPLSTLVANGTLTEGGASEINVKEDVIAAYAKFNFEGMDDRLTGNFGIRIVSTDQESDGNIPDFSTIRFDQGGAETFVDTSESSVSRSYTEVLPSLNLKYELTDDVVLRFGAARVMSRPDLTVLSPATTINVNVRTINSSNPDVDPFLADQLDFSVEWYFEDGGMFSVAPFVKFIDSFVVSSTNQEEVTYSDLDGSNSVTTTFTRFLPDNGKGSDLTGIEFNWQQPLDVIIEGLGFSANYTIVDADEIQASEDGPLLTLDGLSETSYNLVAYYENDTFGARFAYNYRDEFVNNGTNYFGDGSFTGDYSQLDFSASYNVTENVSIDFEALNITDEVLVQTNSLGINRGLEDVGKRFTLGVRAKF